MPHFTSPRPALHRPSLKPRNPCVAPSHQRKAGRHRPAHPRQAAQATLKSELRELWHPPSTD